MPTPYLTLAVLHDTFGAAHIDKLIASTSVDADSFLESINAEVDSYVGAAVSLPPTDAAIGVVRGSAADIARFRLMRASAGEDVRNRFDDAIRFLERVAARKQWLPVPAPDPTEPCESVGLIAASGSAPRLAQRDALRGWW